jgi:hypothetical protein
MSKKPKKEDAVDLRTLPKDERPKPTSGQSAEAFTLPFDSLSKYELKVVSVLNQPGAGLREVKPVSAVAKTTRLTPLQVRNAMRRLVPSKWIERVDVVLADDGSEKPVKGHYRITKGGRERLARELG